MRGNNTAAWDKHAQRFCTRRSIAGSQHFRPMALDMLAGQWPSLAIGTVGDLAQAFFAVGQLRLDSGESATADDSDICGHADGI